MWLGDVYACLRCMGVVAIVMAVFFCREAEAHDGVHVGEAEDQRRHDARHQIGETDEPHE